MKWPERLHLEHLQVSRRPVVQQNEPKDVFLGIGYVHDFAEGDWLRHEITHFKLEVEYFRRAIFGDLFSAWLVEDAFWPM